MHDSIDWACLFVPLFSLNFKSIQMLDIIEVDSINSVGNILQVNFMRVVTFDELDGWCEAREGAMALESLYSQIFAHLQLSRIWVGETHNGNMKCYK